MADKRRRSTRVRTGVAWTAAGRLVAGGKSLEYICFGPPPSEAPTLVLLHEGLGSTQLWRDFPSRLAGAGGFGVFAYSRAGHGRSDPADLPRPLDYMSREAEDVLPEVLDAAGFRDGVLIGHSDGASIAAIYAGRVADPRVRGLVLMAPHFFTEAMGLAQIAQAGAAFDAGGLRQRMGKYHCDPEHTFRGWNNSWLHPDFRSWNISDVIDGIRVPVLAVQGREDQYGTLAQIEVLQTRSPAPVTTLVLDDCRHAPFLDKPAELVPAIAGFSRRLLTADVIGPERG